MRSSRPVSQYLFSVALVAALVFLSVGVSVLTGRITEETLRASVVTVLSGKKKPAVEVKRVRAHGGSSVSFSHVFAANYPDGKTVRVFLVSVTGHSGPFAALYVKSPGSDASFAGLVGVAYPGDAWRYGITDRVLESWADRVTAVAEKYGDDK